MQSAAEALGANEDLVAQVASAKSSRQAALQQATQPQMLQKLYRVQLHTTD